MLWTLLMAATAAKDSMTTLEKIEHLAENFPETLMDIIASSPLSAKVEAIEMPEDPVNAATLPTVTAHGMGDSCFEPGFSSVTRAIAKKTGTYAKCIPTGKNLITDTINGFLMNMDKSVDVFAAKIRADPQLANGFNAIGFSQGNSLIRGYIQRYNDPPVHTFVSVHGTVMGVAAFPQCFRQGKPLGLLCKAVAEICGDLSYIPLVQNLVFQTDYFRDPLRTQTKAYLEHSQLAQWNMENPATANSTFKENFLKTQKFVMVKAMEDHMVYPNEAEWWGQVKDGKYGEIGTMKEMEYYTNDNFGLKTADEQGRILYESTPGDHLRFTQEELMGWVEKYFMGGDVFTV